MINDKSKKNTLMYMHMYKYTHSHSYTNIYKYRYTYSRKHMCYSNHIMLFDSMFASV